MKKNKKIDDDIENGTLADGEGAEAGADEVEALRRERDRLEEQLRRAMADLANFRKRQAKEFDEVRRRTVEVLAAELLPVLDNFHLALAAHEQGPPSEEVRAMLDGLRMVRTMLEGTLERHGLSEIPAEDVTFDPNLHEAVGVDHETESEPGTVSKVVQRGYLLGDKVLRASRVIVAAEQPSESARDDDLEDENGTEEES